MEFQLGTAPLSRKTDSSKIEGYFVDTFASDNPLPEFRDFQTRYQQAYETRAGAMEAVAFDAASIVNQILKRSDENLTRSSMRDLLSQVKNFPGSTGKISFSAGEFVRPLKVFSLSKGSIKRDEEVCSCEQFLHLSLHLRSAHHSL